KRMKRSLVERDGIATMSPMKSIFLLIPLVPGLALPQGALAQPSAPAQAQLKLETEADWQPLTDDASRGELFQRVISAKLAESGQTIEGLKALPGSKREPFQFPQNAKFDAGKPRENSIFGLAISHYTSPDPDFSLLRDQGIFFVYVKATQSTGLKDSRFADFWKKLAALPPDKKLLRGAYHFLSSSTDATAQADTFLKFLALNGGMQAGDLPAVVDLEWDVAGKGSPDRWAGQSPAQILDKTITWLAKVEAQTGKIPMVYTARSWWRERGIPDSDFAKLSHYKIWIA